jgi:hypothetical protein
MTYGSGMIWPLAAEYARRGWAVRRAGWDDLELFGDTGRALRWVVYQNALFWLLYRAAVTGAKATRVIRNTDFGVEDFYAEDWTVLTPACLEMQGGGYGGYGGDPWQGKKPYPRPVDSSPVFDPMYPNAIHGTCPIVPLYEDIRRTFQPTSTQ